jgi:hypothetical protein
MERASRTPDRAPKAGIFRAGEFIVKGGGPSAPRDDLNPISPHFRESAAARVGLSCCKSRRMTVGESGAIAMGGNPSCG